jgi:hypothetical protein
MSSKPNFYIYDNELYSVYVPIHWSATHVSGSGPKECRTCKQNGRWNGVFIGYCEHCAISKYNGTRGRGFICPGVENTRDEVLMYDGAFETYMKGVSLDDVGDKRLTDNQSRIRDYIEGRVIYDMILHNYNERPDEFEIINQYLSRQN